MHTYKLVVHLRKEKKTLLSRLLFQGLVWMRREGVNIGDEAVLSSNFYWRQKGGAVWQVLTA